MAITAEQAISALLAKGFYIQAQGGEIYLHNDADLGITINPARGTLEVGQSVLEPNGIARERLIGLEITYRLADCSINMRGDIKLGLPIKHSISHA